MSRVANAPVSVPSGVEINVDGRSVNVKGPKGVLSFDIHPVVDMVQEEGVLRFEARERSRRAVALTGCMRSIVHGMVTGVSDGFEKKLELQGVGYRAQVQGANLNLTVGYSHPIDYPIPEGVTIETPTQTEIVVKGVNKQQVGQVAAEIRAMRTPEPYKGKGVRYSDERVVMKEAKKK